jgi:alkylation response protein AidB-like acyl-CoA dehydrogenase
MRFALTDEQLAFAEAIRDLLTRECGPAALRAAWESDGGLIPGLWAKLAEMGVVGMLAPEGVGGLELGEVELTAVLVEAGRAAAPAPLTDVAMVAVPAIRDHAQTDDAESILTRICAGTATIAVGLGGGQIVDARPAAAYLLEAPDGLHLVDPDVVELDPVTSVDGSRRLARCSWVPSPATAMSGGPAAALDARARGAVGTAAELCGLADTMIAMTVAYTSQRQQFGVPVGSFQAVKHRLADALVGVEFAKPLVWRAAVSLSVGDVDAPLHASMAKSAASDAAEGAAAAALQCHGAIGYTVEHDLHLFMKRAWALSRRYGDSRSHRREVAGRLLGNHTGVLERSAHI